MQMKPHQGWMINYSGIGNNPANCSKQYLKRDASLINSRRAGYFWPISTVQLQFYPEIQGKYFISEPTCLVVAKVGRESISFESLVDTRYDTKQKPDDYAFQTGNIVTAIVNLPSNPRGHFEKLYFTDNNAAYNYFSRKYCVIKGPIDPMHCTRSASGGYRGIDIRKNGRLYNLFAFEQMTFAPIVQGSSEKFGADGQPTLTRGGMIGYQWWVQTLGAKTAYWEIDHVDPEEQVRSQYYSTYNTNWVLGK
jgi:hypothetical protein